MRASNQRAACGRIGGLTTSARLGGMTMTAPARRGFRQRFEQDVDPDGHQSVSCIPLASTSLRQARDVAKPLAALGWDHLVS
jgi:hypothetical protein